MGDYIHGYAARESARLTDQGEILRDLIHRDLHFPAGSRVLEAGCGTGSQTRFLLDSSPGIRLTCLDLDAGQLDQARTRLAGRAESIDFRQGDLLDAPFAPASFDHAFVCFLLEHLRRPAEALAHLARLLRPGGTLTLIEGDHGSCRFHPETAAALAVWEALVTRQRRLGGDPMIGRRLYGLLHAAGFVQVRVEPRMVYADAGSPALRAAFVRRIIVPMVDGVRAATLADGMTARAWSRGIDDLLATDADAAGSFCYSFFAARAQVP